jgi:hypothetical protein
MKTLWAVILSSLAFAASGVDTPSAGFALGADGTLIRVSGIGGAFVTAVTEHSGVVSSGFSGQLGFLKMPATIRVLNARGELVSELEASEGPAFFGFNKTGDAGVVYYPEAAALAVYVSRGWRGVPFQTDGDVIAVRLEDFEHLSAIVGRDQFSLVSIRTSDGAIENETALGPARAPVLLPPGGGVLFASEQGLIYRDADGFERTVTDCTGIATLRMMGSSWVQVELRSGGNLAVRLTPEIRVYGLPEVAQ